MLKNTNFSRMKRGNEKSHQQASKSQSNIEDVSDISHNPVQRSKISRVEVVDISNDVNDMDTSYLFDLFDNDENTRFEPDYWVTGSTELQPTTKPTIMEPNNYFYTEEEKKLDDDIWRRFLFSNVKMSLPNSDPPDGKDYLIPRRTIINQMEYDKCVQQPTIISKTEVMSEIYHFSQDYQLEKNGLKDLFKLIHLIAPEANIYCEEFKKKSTEEEMEAEKQAKTREKVLLADYANRSKHSIVEFDVCPNGDHVFIGASALAVKCPHCEETRFTHCTHVTCATKKYEACKHDIDQRTSRRILSYRPLINLLVDLLKMEGFRRMLCYQDKNVEDDEELLKDFTPEKERARHYHRHGDKEKVFGDVLSGEEVRKHTRGMVRDFLLKMKLGYFQQEYHTNNVQSVNLLLAVYYDGAQVYSTRFSHFWPLFLSILNLPPTVRKMWAAGLFMSALFTSTNKRDSSSYAEKFLLKHCLANEIMRLEKGHMLVLDGQHYWIQARIIMHCYDTKGAEHVFDVQTCNSLAGCFLCRLCPGTRVNEISTTCYPESRKHLPKNHPFLDVGTKEAHVVDKNDNITGQIIEEKEDNGNEIEEDEVGDKEGVDDGYGEIKVDGLKITVEQDNTFGLEDEVDNNNYQGGAHATAATASTLSPPSEYLMFNSEYKYSDFSAFCYAEFKYDRANAQVELKEVSNDVYLADCVTIFEHNKNKAKTTKKADHINGIKAPNPFVNLLYSNIMEQFIWDMFHILLNICHNILTCFKTGSDGDLGKIGKYCEKRGLFPQCFRKDIDAGTGKKRKVDGEYKEEEKKKMKYFVPIWAINQETQNCIDLWLGSILIPGGRKHDFEIKHLFLRSTNVPGCSKIKVFTHLMDFFCLCIRTIKPSYPKAYLKFYNLTSDIFRRLSKNTYRQSEIKPLFNRIAEYVSLHELMYPINEAKIIFHQLLHLPLGIERFGACLSWCTLAAERGISKVKESVTCGGQKMNKTTGNRVHHRELSKAQQYFESFQLPNTKTGNWTAQQEKQFNDILPEEFYSLNYDPDFNDYILQFDNEKIQIKDKNPRDVHDFTDYEFNLLFKDLAHDVVGTDSPLYRLEREWDYQKKTSDVLFRPWLRHVLLTNHNQWWTGESKCGQKNKIRYATGKHDRRVAELLVSFQPLSHRRLLYAGYSLTARGFHYREKDIATDPGYGTGTIQTNNPLNTIRNYWHKRNHYSSWMKLKKGDRTLYAMTNYFFRFSGELANLIGYIDGMVIASICAYSGRPFAGTEMHAISMDLINTEYDSTFRFASVQDQVFPGAVGIVGFDKINHLIPIVTDSTVIGTTTNNVKDYYSTDRDSIKRLVFIDLDSHDMKEMEM